jgi:PAS domain S-box-containing protein
MRSRKSRSRNFQINQEIHNFIVDFALDWAWAIDAEGNHIYSNQAVEQLLGYQVEEIIGKPAYFLMHPEDQERVRKIAQKSMMDKVGWKQLEIRWMKKDGSIRYFESTSQPYFDDAGNLAGFCGIDRDVTKRVEAEEALRKINNKLEQRIKDRTQELENVVDDLQRSVEEFIKTEKILQETELRYNALFEGSSDSVFIISLDDKLISANEQAAILVGYDREELATMPLSKFMRFSEWEDAEKKSAALMEGEIIPPYERILIKKDGTEVPVEVNLTLIRDEDGNPKYFQSITRDISERKKIESSLKESEEKFRLAFERGPLGIAIADQNFVIMDANEKFCQITGYPEDDIIGSSFDKYTHPDDMEVERILFEKLFNNEMPSYKVEKRYITKSGKIVWINLTASIVRDQQGNPQYALGIAENITKRKQAEESIRASEARFRALFDHAGYAITVTNRGQTLMVNKAYLDLFGYSDMEEVVGRQVIEQVAPQEHDRMIEYAQQRAIGNDPPAFYETIGRKKDGTHFDIDVRVSTYNLLGETFTLDILRDLTDRKQAEAEVAAYRAHLEQLVEERTMELQNSNEELKAFAYSVSHDLRAPLRAIRGFGDILYEEYIENLDETAKDYLRRIRSSATQMDELITGLLEFSRAAYREIHHSEVDLSKIAEDVIGSYWQENEGRDVEVSIEPGVNAVGDPRLMRIVLANLLENAWKFTLERTEAKIEFGCKEGVSGSVYFVRDNGIGFDLAYSEKMFKVFQRLHKEDEFEGVGIGLATVKKIIERHGGEIWAEAEVGKGATFFFTLKSE